MDDARGSLWIPHSGEHHVRSDVALVDDIHRLLFILRIPKPLIGC